ncbi:transketolase family protein [Mycoplasma sp. SG1]|uniref:transketolase family protein n=1 Tax=Mycoplasma sp. SG1 TaxID=2810348 RepID=UPI002023F74A|nr:transketolase [Mycoplasma sp. SG1]URM53067.1 transketolase [Mycoplasma sp. SG1]
MSKKEIKDKEFLTINNIRFLGCDAIQKANSGHPGIVLGMAPVLYELFSKFMIFNPEKPNWINRDYFILSAGHGSALLYSILSLFNYNISQNDIKGFRSTGSKTPGHPEYNPDLGIEATTGPLGQGIGMAVGLAMSLKNIAATYNKEELKIFNQKVYVLAGDGCLEEGISYESASLAGHLKLDNLILIYDSNNIQLDSPINYSFSNDIKLQFQAMHWNYFRIENANNLSEISNILTLATNVNNNQPTIIEVKSVIGYGSPLQGSPKSHGAAFSSEDYQKTKEFFKWKYPAFTVLPEVKELINSYVDGKIQDYKTWLKTFERYKKQFPDQFKELDNLLSRNIKVDWAKLEKSLKTTKPEATRVSTGKILAYLTKDNYDQNLFFGGSSDLSGSTKVIVNTERFSSADFKGRNVYFGARDFGLGPFVNGINLSRFHLGFGADFFAFSQYCLAGIRLAALMNLNSLWFFSHDSLYLGEDGPTHQPIEQFVQLRVIPNIILFRPADINESIGVFKSILEFKYKKPIVVITSRQNVEQLSCTKANEVASGGYIAVKEKAGLVIDFVIVATGSELATAVYVAEELKMNFKKNVRVVSMVSTNLFDLQTKSYQNAILPSTPNKIFIEMGLVDSWYKYGDKDSLYFGPSSFGLSGTGDDVVKSFKLSKEDIYKAVVKKYQLSKKSNW